MRLEILAGRRSPQHTATLSIYQVEANVFATATCRIAFLDLAVRGGSIT